MDFYTFFTRHKSNLLISGYENGGKVNRSIKLKPYLFVQSPDETEYKTIDGQYVSRVDFQSPYEAREFVKEYGSLENYPIYGMTNYDYVAINDMFKDIKADHSKVRIGNYDIETDSEGGYADIETADKEVISVQMHVMGDKEIYVLGLKDYDTSDPHGRLKAEGVTQKIVYKKCRDEEELLRLFIRLWVFLKMDVVTGWNIEGYDHVYMIRRIRRILGEEAVKEMSPFGLIESEEYEMYGKKQERFNFVGIPTLDYMQCYKKFSFKNVESYKLDYISHLVLKKKKLDYSQYKTLANLYKQDPQMFYDYGIIDIVRVAELEAHLKFIDLIIGTAHLGKFNMVDAFATVKPWDVFIHNYLMDRKIVIPAKKMTSEEHRVIAGGYVKPPHVGHHKYIMSFDLTSLYPHIIMAMNLSPETFVDKINKYDNLGTIDKLLAGTMLEDGTVIDSEFTQHRQNLTDNNLVLTPKGTVFTRDKQGFIPAIMKFLFEERKVYKTKMLKAKDGKEHAKTPEEKKIFEQQISEYNAKQNALKVLLNGGYGALANVHFRWFDYNIAESITLTGQYIIRCTEKHMNLFLNKILKTSGVDYVVAVDTDSNYINVTKVVDKMFPNGGSQEDITIFLEKFAVQVETYAIDEAFKEIYHSTNAFDECLHMKLEAIGQAVWKAAKMYIMAVWSMEGVRYAVPDIKMQGIEAVRSSTPEICRKYIKDSLPFIVAKDEKGLKEHILKCEEEFFKQPFHRVAKPGGVTEITKWEDNNTIYKKGVPYHVRAAITYNNLVRKKGLDGEMPLINNGDKMRLCYMTMPNPLRENVFACPDELPEEFGVERYIDYVTQFYKTFKKPITGLTDAAGISISDKMDLSQFY